jgi:hypothetical protein
VPVDVAAAAPRTEETRPSPVGADGGDLVVLEGRSLRTCRRRRRQAVPSARSRWRVEARGKDVGGAGTVVHGGRAAPYGVGDASVRRVGGGEPVAGEAEAGPSAGWTPQCPIIRPPPHPPARAPSRSRRRRSRAPLRRRGPSPAPRRPPPEARRRNAGRSGSHPLSGAGDAASESAWSVGVRPLPRTGAVAGPAPVPPGRRRSRVSVRGPRCAVRPGAGRRCRCRGGRRGRGGPRG